MGTVSPSDTDLVTLYCRSLTIYTVEQCIYLLRAPGGVAGSREARSAALVSSPLVLKC
jgi:hypothetical protein